MLCKALKHDFRRFKSLLSLIGSHPILSASDIPKVLHIVLNLRQQIELVANGEVRIVVEGKKPDRHKSSFDKINVLLVAF